MREPTPAQRVCAALEVHLGPNTARVAVRAFAERALGVSPEAVTAEQLPALLDALRPMLRTLIGSAAADATLEPLRSHRP